MKSASILFATIVILSILSAVIWYGVWREGERVLTVSFLDIGQGDAIYIRSPQGNELLIDGGPDSGVLRRLGAIRPWYDRTIEMVIATHPDSDHSGGLIDVLTRYRVSTIALSSVDGDTPIWSTFERAAGAEGARILIAERGEIIDLGDGAYLEILFPDRSVPGLETNTGCVVARLVYGTTAFMLSCDAPSSIENYLAELDGPDLKSDVLKAGHHGSKTSSSRLFVGYVDPEYAVYSRGCDNKYGHPNRETVETFVDMEIPTLDTCTNGTITFVSDGKSVRLK